MIPDPWGDRIPIYGRLPVVSGAYYGNPICHALVAGLDEILSLVKDSLDYTQRDWIDPDTCRSDVLDWRAEKEGLVIPGFWRFDWNPEIKRELIKKAPWIFLNKGRTEVIEFLIGLFAIEATVYLLGGFRFDVDVFESQIGGTPSLEFYVLVSHLTQGGVFVARDSENWKLIEAILYHFSPVFAHSQVVYRQFRFDISLFSEPFLG